ncbi:MAG: ATP-grasp domain-containing protein [Actinomycetota bacterium]|nr:ATP-grasp domain-containing protein [Actinomycetota bacterium]
MPKHLVFVTWKAGNAPAFEAAKRLGHYVTLVRSTLMEEYQGIDFDRTSYGEFVDSVQVLRDATELDALRDCLAGIHASRPIDGFIASVDALVVPVATLAEELGVPFTSARGAAIAKLKHRCRDELAAAGLDTTAHRIVVDRAAAEAFVAEAGLPVVIKPASGSGSDGAHVIRDLAELRTAFPSGPDGAHGVYADGVLMEQYLTGTFVSAEVALIHGRFVRLAITDRKTWPRHEPLELGVTIPAAIPAADREAVMSFAERAVRALDLRMGVFHVEVMVRPDGQVSLIEFNPRVMGSCLPQLFSMASGVDLFEVLVRIYLDEDVDLSGLTFDSYATVRWFGAADRQRTPTEQPDLSALDQYGGAVRSLTVAYPDTPELEPCRGNVGNFGEVQVCHEDHATSVRIAERIVADLERQLGFELTR